MHTSYTYCGSVDSGAAVGSGRLPAVIGEKWKPRATRERLLAYCETSDWYVSTCMRQLKRRVSQHTIWLPRAKPQRYYQHPNEDVSCMYEDTIHWKILTALNCFSGGHALWMRVMVGPQRPRFRCFAVHFLSHVTHRVGRISSAWSNARACWSNRFS